MAGLTSIREVAALTSPTRIAYKLNKDTFLSNKAVAVVYIIYITAVSVTWQHCIDNADKQNKSHVTRLSSRRSSAADRQSVKRDYNHGGWFGLCCSHVLCFETMA